MGENWAVSLCSCDFTDKIRIIITIN